MSTLGLSRFFSSLIIGAPVIILLVSIFIALYVYDISRTADDFLDNNYRRHMDTRGIIKANLLVQKGLGQATLALQGDDEAAFYAALDRLEGGQTFLFGRIGGTIGELDNVSLLMAELVTELGRLGAERFSGGPAPSLAVVRGLQQRADGIFSLLASADNRNWSETVFESARKHKSLDRLYGFFFFLCVFLGVTVALITIAAGKSRKAERALQRLAQELEARIEQRTEELSWAYQELVTQSSLLQTILDTIPAPIFYKDAQGVYLGCNQAFENFIGLPRDRVIGSTVFDVAPRELADAYQRADLELIRRGGTQIYETTVRHADSSLHDVLFHKAVFHNQDGSPGGQVGAMLDITEHKKAEAELLKREQIFHGIFDQTFSFMGLLSPEGDLLEVNHTALALIDVAPDEVRGRPFWETAWWSYSPKGQQQLREGVGRAAAGQVVRFETAHQRGDRLLVIDFSLKPIMNDRQQVIYILAEGRDISRIKQHEKMLLSIAEGISSHTGEEFFRTLAAAMAETMNADYAFVAQFKDGSSDLMETLAYCAEGRIRENIEYRLEDTPSRDVIARQTICSYPAGVARLFPADLRLRQLEVEGYVGFPLIATSGESLGVLSVLFRRPLTDVPTVEHLVKIFGGRAAGEMERLRNRIRLEESEESFRTIFQAGPDPAVVARLDDQCIVDCNEAFSLHTGYARDEVLGKSALEVGIRANPEDCRRVHELLQKQGLVENFEFVSRKQNGQLASSLLSMRIIQLRGVAHLLVVTRDITEVKKAQQALQDSERRYRELYNQFQVLLDGIPDALLLFSGDLKVVWANRGAATHFSTTVEALAGMACHDLWSEQAGTCITCAAEVFRAGTAQEKSLKTADGRYWGIKTFPIKDSAGRVVNAIQIASEITEKIRLREHADQASRLVALGELSAGVAHEINNPNGQLLLNLPLIADAIADSLPILDRYRDAEGDFRWAGVRYSRMRHEIPQLVEEMQDAAGRIRTIVDDLKHFSRKECIDQTQLFSLNDALETAVRLSGTTIKSSTDSFHIAYGEDLPPITCVRQRIEQVLVNLLINACQALPARSRGIFVETRHETESNQVFCEIRDEGIGMSAEVLSHATDPFFTTRREVGGTGLGLSISARIAREHGGELRLTSQPGAGTRAVVSFRVT